MSRRTLNLGMVGAGYIGQIAHLANFSEVPACQLTGLAEFRPNLRAKVGRRYEIPKTYDTHDKLIDNRDIDGVLVVVPRSQTFAVVRDCLNAGKHVFSEKPMAVSSDEGRELMQIAKAKQLRYCVGYMKRYDGGVQAAKQILDDALSNNELGPILFVRAHCYMGNSFCNADGHIVTDEKPEYSENYTRIAPDWVPLEQKQNYGSFINTYSHLTNLLRFFLDRDPKIDYTRLASPDSQLAVLNYGDFVASLETGRSTDRNWDELVEIQFADGRMTIQLPPALLRNAPAKVTLYRAGETQEILSPVCDWTWAFRSQAESVASDWQTGRDSLIEASEALKDLELAEALWKFELSK